MSEATLDGPVMLPDGFVLADASFERSGQDLVLTASDGTNVTVSDFFASDPPPSLATPEGALVSGTMAGLLAVPAPSDQIIEAGTDTAAEAIGTINTISGKAFVVRVDGSRVELNIDTPLYAGDILETDPDGAIGVVLADETTLAMGGDGRMVLDEMIYDPGTQEGSLSLVALKGVYTIVSGMVSKTDPDAMVIDTPVGSIGIRGTQIGLDFADGENLTVVMMREADGYVGEVFIRNEGGTQVMNEVNQVIFAGAYTRPPVFMASVDDSDILRMFETTLVHLPMTTGRANDYTTQEQEGGGELDAFTTDAGNAEEDTPPPPEEVIRVGEEEYTPPPAPEPVTIAPTQPLDPVESTSTPLTVDEDRDDATLITTEPFATAGIVVAPNADPAADDQVVATSEDQPLSGQLSATDTDEDTLSYALADDGAPGHGSVIINADGTYTYTPPADFSGTDSFSYTVSDGEGGATTATVSVNVAAVSDVPVLSVSAASGAEDTAISLAISATVPGSEELATLTISGVPDGATLSAGTDNGDGSWTLDGDALNALDTLTMTPPADWSGDIVLTVGASSTDGGTATAGFGVAVTAAPDLPVVTVSAASGAEDTAIALAISATVPGSEELASLTISGVPDGATLSAGTDNGDGSWTLSGDDLNALDNLTLTPPADWSGDIALTAGATSTDGGTATAGFGVSVTAVPDLPVISVSAVSGAEDTAIPLSISTDVPGAEEIASLTISGVPEGAVLSAGTDNDDGSWTFSGEDLNNIDSLTLTPAADWSGDMNLTITAASTDGGTATAGFGIAVTAVPDLPVISVSAASGAEDTSIPLTISADVPGSEELASIIISGVPDGATLSAGVDNGDGSWTLSGDNLNNLDTLTLTPPVHSSDDLALSISVTSTDGGTASASFGVTVAAVADTPSLQVSDTVYGEGGHGGEGGEGGHGGEGGEGGKIKGTGGDDILYGTGGDDVIIGKGGADILYGYRGEGSVAVVPLLIDAALTDTDSSETLGIAITGVPEDATLSAGTDMGGGLWTLNPDELEGLSMTLPEGYQDDFQLAVTATATDVDIDTGDTDQATASANISVVYEGGEGGSGYGGDDLLKGGGGDDILYGGGGEDDLRGEGGDDILHGGAGDDELRGQGGDDELYGGAGDDVLKGEGGDDVLIGGAGDDILKGGGGKDTFVFDSQAGRDIIEDFREGEVLRFEGPEFSAENLSVSQSGDNVSVMFEGQEVEVTINDLDLTDQSYSITQDGDAVLITFEGEH